MRSTFQLDLEELQKDVLRMGTLVEEAIGLAMLSLVNGDLDLARGLIERDDVVDRMQRDIETRCLEIIALQQPIAGDLRIVSSALKMVRDLERMGDHAVDIARVTLRLGVGPPIDFARMAEMAQRMTREALRAYVRRDPDVAREVLGDDDAVDRIYREISRELFVYMAEDSRTIQPATDLLFVAQHLERVADHATNLGESVIFMVCGEYGAKPLARS